MSNGDFALILCYEHYRLRTANSRKPKLAIKQRHSMSYEFKLGSEVALTSFETIFEGNICRLKLDQKGLLDIPAFTGIVINHEFVGRVHEYQVCIQTFGTTIEVIEMKTDKSWDFFGIRELLSSPDALYSFERFELEWDGHDSFEVRTPTESLRIVANKVAAASELSESIITLLRHDLSSLLKEDTSISPLQSEVPQINHKNLIESITQLEFGWLSNLLMKIGGEINLLKSSAKYSSHEQIITCWNSYKAVYLPRLQWIVNNLCVPLRTAYKNFIASMPANMYRKRIELAQNAISLVDRVINLCTGLETTDELPDYRAYVPSDLKQVAEGIVKASHHLKVLIDDYSLLCFPWMSQALKEIGNGSSNILFRENKFKVLLDEMKNGSKIFLTCLNALKKRALKSSKIELIYETIFQPNSYSSIKKLPILSGSAKLFLYVNYYGWEIKGTGTMIVCTKVNVDEAFDMSLGSRPFQIVWSAGKSLLAMLLLCGGDQPNPDQHKVDLVVINLHTLRKGNHPKLLRISTGMRWQQSPLIIDFGQRYISIDSNRGILILDLLCWTSIKRGEIRAMHLATLVSESLGMEVKIVETRTHEDLVFTLVENENLADPSHTPIVWLNALRWRADSRLELLSSLEVNFQYRYFSVLKGLGSIFACFLTDDYTYNLVYFHRKIKLKHLSTQKLKIPKSMQDELLPLHVVAKTSNSLLLDFASCTSIFKIERVVAEIKISI